MKNHSCRHPALNLCVMILPLLLWGCGSAEKKAEKLLEEAGSAFIAAKDKAYAESFPEGLKGVNEALAKIDEIVQKYDKTEVAAKISGEGAIVDGASYSELYQEKSTLERLAELEENGALCALALKDSISDKFERARTTIDLLREWPDAGPQELIGELTGGLDIPSGLLLPYSIFEPDVRVVYSLQLKNAGFSGKIEASVQDLMDMSQNAGIMSMVALAAHYAGMSDAASQIAGQARSRAEAEAPSFYDFTPPIMGIMEAAYMPNDYSGDLSFMGFMSFKRGDQKDLIRYFSLAWRYATIYGENSFPKGLSRLAEMGYHASVCGVSEADRFFTLADEGLARYSAEYPQAAQGEIPEKWRRELLIALLFTGRVGRAEEVAKRYGGNMTLAYDLWDAKYSEDVEQMEKAFVALVEGDSPFDYEDMLIPFLKVFMKMRKYDSARRCAELLGGLSPDYSLRAKSLIALLIAAKPSEDAELDRKIRHSLVLDTL